VQAAQICRVYALRLQCELRHTFPGARLIYTLLRAVVREYVKKYLDMQKMLVASAVGRVLIATYASGYGHGTASV
jgi:hypothetical protein